MHVLFPNTLQDLIQQGPGAMMCHGIVTENNDTHEYDEYDVQIANCSHTTQRNQGNLSLINLFAVPFLAGYLYGP